MRFGGPGRGRKVGDALDGQISKSWQHIGGIFTDRIIEHAAAFDNRENGGRARAGLGVTDVDPVFASARYRADGVESLQGCGQVLRRCFPPSSER